MIDPDLSHWYVHGHLSWVQPCPRFTRLVGLLAVGLLCGLLLSGCATTPQGKAVEVQVVKASFPVALHAAVAVQTQVLLAWHPDLVPYLLQWLEAVCAFAPGSATSPAQFQELLLGALFAIPNMPPWAHAVIADFVPIVVGLIPIALQVAEASVPQAGAVMVVASDVCKWIQQAIPPNLLPAKGP